jgi:hypothetical protein
MGERFAANSPPAADPNNLNYLNSSTAQAYGEPILPRALDTAVDPTKVFDPTKPFTNPTYPSLDVVKPVVETVKPATGGSGFMDALSRGASRAYDIASQGAKDLYEGYKAAPAPLQYLSAGMAAKKFLVEEPKGPEKYKGPRANMSAFLPDGPQMPSTYLYGANGGIMQSYAEGGVPTSGGPVEQMSNMNVNAMGGNMMYPMSQQHTNVYGTGINQRPMSVDMLTDGANNVDPYTGEQHSFAEGGLSIKDYQRMSGGRSGTDLENDIAQAQHAMAKAKGHEGLGKISRGRGTAGMSALDAAMADINALNKKTGIKAAPMAMAKMSDPTAGNHVDDASYAEGGGIAYHLGGYSDGGRLLKGPGDGVSDSIPATIGRKQPARLADGEFVIPARIVSELGNGSTEAGARQLYAMMDRVQHGRKKSIGKGKVAVNSKANKHLPA